jgi:hypothetical protein
LSGISLRKECDFPDDKKQRFEYLTERSIKVKLKKLSFSYAFVFYLRLVLLQLRCLSQKTGATSAPMLATATTNISPIVQASITPTETVVQVAPTPSPAATLPQFEHIAMIVLENRSYDEMIGNPVMPYFNKLANQNVLLTNYFAVTHPSLPNYIAMISGSTQGITKDCKDCFCKPAQPGGFDRSQRAQLENLPGRYARAMETSDAWLKTIVSELQASTAFGKNSLIIVTVDEADDKQTESCCGMGDQAGGRVATLLISPLANAPMQDPTAYSQYGLLKTILQAWNLPDLGNTAKPETSPILAPWSK